MTCVFRDKILQCDKPVPRYTSYPTAPHFKAAGGEDIYLRALAKLPLHSRISLYLHIPYCPKLCWYCGCNTKITQKYDPVENYVHLMLREINMLASVLDSSHTVSHIHFGGGSPGMLRPKDFSRIMSHLRQAFNIRPSAEIAIELDPREISEARVATYAKQGVNRVSLGVQDFDHRVLKSVNRVQPFHLSYNAVELMRSYGIDKINFDLLYGLPAQSLNTMEETIEKALSLAPDRVSLFGYAHVPWMKKHMRLIDEESLPRSALRFDLFDLGSQLLQDAGYRAIGIDHFARPEDPLSRAALAGTLKRNFQGYTTDTADAMIGIGASSIGLVGDHYFQNAPDMPAYRKVVSSSKLPVYKACALSTEDRLRKDVIERLMCDLKADLDLICNRHGFESGFFDPEFTRLFSYQKMGFIKIENGIISINNDARAMVRIICSVFDSYIKEQPETRRHAHAV
jgi:oxygen-independent coproporphyrinogen-3 oxidase